MDVAIEKEINRLHERASRIVYSDYTAFFEGFLNKDNSFSIHERNIQSLAIENYKFLNGLSPSFLNNVFKKQNPQTHIHFEIDKIFIPEILGQLDMELKPYHI